MRIRAQLSFCLSPSQSDFVLSRAESAFTVADAGPRPWSQAQFEAVQTSHVNNLTSYIAAIALESLSMCQEHGTRMAVNGGIEGDDEDDVGEGIFALLSKVVLDLKDSMRSMTMEAADAFASYLESFLVEPDAAAQMSTEIPVRCPLLCQ